MAILISTSKQKAVSNVCITKAKVCFHTKNRKSYRFSLLEACYECKTPGSDPGCIFLLRESSSQIKLQAWKRGCHKEP